MHKLVVFGSARVDGFMYLPDDMAKQHCNIDKQKCVIELNYASKLPLNDVRFLVGGNGANVAVGAKRLGVDSVLVAELGQGPLADFALVKLKNEIATNYVTQTEEVNQGFGAVIVYQGERTILSYYSPERPPFPSDLEPSEWAYLTSVGDKFEDYYEDVYKWLDKNSTKLAFNPGGRQIGKGRDWLQKYIDKTNTLIVNREEAEGIIEFSSSHGKEKELMDMLCECGPDTVVVTDGRDGVYAKHEGKYYKAGILPVDSHERTGAGDAFSAGFLSAILNGQSIQQALLWGISNSGSVIGYIGPQKGLLNRLDMDKWLERAKSSNVKVEEF